MSTQSEPRTKPTTGIIVALIIIIVVLFACVLGSGGGGSAGGGSSASAAPDRISVWTDCRTFVTQNLKAPLTAEFPLSNAEGITIAHISSTDRWSVIGYVDAQNSFGAKIRQEFGCQVSYSGGTATLHKLRIGDSVLIDQ